MAERSLDLGALQSLLERVHDLKQLVTAYQLGWIPEARCEDHVW